ncbi:uncharacterized protein (TIGR04141 family) [Spinactinospora alkalitolerans]|uniref:Uncharacterized protein (TIGR04141 family) n=1 Tax=Spinactinospora alkalitolerans TaxID=687207 RepID=A0A852U0L4_9ACTN|nr:DUF6119 family protein [Spinactinospora alkalitolerans]NYE50376.1 uncharacterized protein (TIGR04141 family) [Spinactinospora alkalitolerans]
MSNSHVGTRTSRRCGKRVAARTQELTLHRLIGVEPRPEDMRAVFDEQGLRNDGLRMESVNVGGMVAVVVHGLRGGVHPPDWLDNARSTTGLHMELEVGNPAVTVLIAVDASVYAFSYGEGHHLVPRELRESAFGRRFAARVADSTAVTTVRRRRMDVPGRYEHTRIAHGGNVRTYGVRPERDIVTGLRVRSGANGLTYTGITGRLPYVDCADGVRTRLGVAPGDLVNDIRWIAEVERSVDPRDDFRILEAHTEERDPERLQVLWDLFAECLGDPESLELAIAPPEDALDDLERTRSFVARIGPKSCPLRTDCDPDSLRTHLVARLKQLQTGNVVAALRAGWIQLYSDPDGRWEIRKHTRPLDWIEATVNMESEIFVLRHGHWYRYGADYLQAVRDNLQRLLSRGSPIELPAWGAGDEGDYNDGVHDPAAGYLCLDRNLVKTPAHWGRGIELCDLLGPGNRLIHVKQAASASALSHLFIQVRSALESLEFETEARERFVRRVKELDPDRDIDESFRPRTVVFAVHLRNHGEVDVDTLYPLAQVELYRTTKALDERNIDVELVGIPHA